MIKAEIKDDLCEKILRLEGIIDSIVTPQIGITNWETAFQTLKKENKNIIVEKKSLNEDESEFIIGRIEKVYKKFAYVRHFDADSIWSEEPYRIPFSQITNITFASRYVDVFSKYLGGLPDNFGK